MRADDFGATRRCFKNILLAYNEVSVASVFLLRLASHPNLSVLNA
jgi:hypothetical protein